MLITTSSVIMKLKAESDRAWGEDSGDPGDDPVGMRAAGPGHLRRRRRVGVRRRHRVSQGAQRDRDAPQLAAARRRRRASSGRSTPTWPSSTPTSSTTSRRWSCRLSNSGWKETFLRLAAEGVGGTTTTCQWPVATMLRRCVSIHPKASSGTVFTSPRRLTTTSLKTGSTPF